MTSTFGYVQQQAMADKVKLDHDSLKAMHDQLEDESKKAQAGFLYDFSGTCLLSQSL